MNGYFQTKEKFKWNYNLDESFSIQDQFFYQLVYLMVSHQFVQDKIKVVYDLFLVYQEEWLLCPTSFALS
jgi:hypothetical protein